MSKTSSGKAGRQLRVQRVVRHPGCEIQDIPNRKPRDYPEDFRKWEWIGNAMRVHAHSKRIYGKRITTYMPRTDRGRDQVWKALKKRFPYAFAK